MEIKGKKVLVTGAGGFIGSHLVEALIGKDCEVIPMVHYNSFNSWGWLNYISQEKKDKIKVFSCDIRDPNGVRSAMAGTEVVFILL